MTSSDGDDRRRALVERAEQVVAGCVDATGVDAGGVALVTTRGHRATVCATNDVAARIEDAQFVLGEGPCVDAAASRTPVLVGDLLDPLHGVDGRWPGFQDAAAEVGVRAVFAFPLRIGAIALGAMDLVRASPGALEADQLASALLAADTTAMLLLDLATVGDDLADDAWHRSAYRFKVHGAAGMVMVQLGLPIEQAMARLRARAYVEGRALPDVADDVVEGRLRFQEEDV